MFTIHHSGGSTDTVVNQQQPSGSWFHLGAFSMSPGQSHRVEVYGALEGETVADAVRFVSAGVSAPGISYVHADHLGSPQKMTDSSKAIVWDAVFTPFGKVHSITGTATNNQRFPGQYVDQETGYSYNYFRDYDPTTGRYIQSDPIGLRGGLNTYGYVGGNPVSRFDYFGLRPLLECTKEFLKPFFQDLDLDQIEVYDEGLPFPFNLIPGIHGVSFGDEIYFDPGYYHPYSVGGTGDIAHELAHSDQWQSDSSFAYDYLSDLFSYGYNDNPYEQEAWGYEVVVESLLNWAGGHPSCEKDPCFKGK